MNQHGELQQYSWGLYILGAKVLKASVRLQMGLSDCKCSADQQRLSPQVPFTILYCTHRTRA